MSLDFSSKIVSTTIESILYWRIDTTSFNATTYIKVIKHPSIYKNMMKTSLN